MSELPKGWFSTRLGELGTWSSGGTPSRKYPEYYGGEIPWVKTGDLKDQPLSDTPEKITPDGLKNSSAKLFPKGTLLIAMYGATIGKTARLELEASTNQACAAFLPEGSSGDLIPYLWQYAIGKRSAFIAAGQGGAQPNISQALIKEFPIALPPLSEQKRIVAKLDALSARSTRARKDLDRIDTLLKRYKQAVLSKAFSGELTKDWRDGAKNWTRKHLSEIAKVGTGATPKRGNAEFYDDGSIPWITSGAVNQGEVTEAEQYITDAAIKQTNCKVFPAGTLILAMYGEGKTRGKVARLDIDAATNQAVAAVQIENATTSLPRFVHLFLESRYLALRDEAAGGVQPNLNLSIVKAIEVPLPAIDEQKEIVRRIESAFQKVDKLAAEAKRALALTDKLDEAFLAKAFRGDLVPQDPNDEPANVLLDRIKAERAAAPKPKRGRRKV